ncbi:MAG TPA: response regulator transcription factor [Pyrinomonadaceae bacterium]
MNILIVEDSTRMRETIISFLRDLAENMFECVSGPGAFNAYRRWRPDWVLMDLEMPRLDGFTLTRQIKAAYPDAKIVIISSYDDAELYSAAESAGACAYVVKEDLLALRRILIESV